MTTLIEANYEKYLSDVISELPENCRLHKSLTGCGATTIAINSKKPYVICVPFKSMIFNKVSQHPNILGVYGGVSDDDIKNYTGDKIMVTYDSLGRLINFIDPSKYNILIDEYHKLIDSGSFRSSAIKTVMGNYDKFAAYTFLTATPPQDKYLYKELAEIPKAVVRWRGVTPVAVNYTILDKPKVQIEKELAIHASRYIRNEVGYEANPYYFFNSVRGIIKTIKAIKVLHNKYGLPFSHEDVKIVCANNDANEAAIRKGLGVKYKIDTVDTPVKSVTFLTATMFEGSDIYDENGKTIIVSDGKKEHTKYDILTLIPQIIGRIRDSKYAGCVEAIFTPSPFFSFVTAEDFEIYVKEQLEEASYAVQQFEQAKQSKFGAMVAGAILKDSLTNNYLTSEDVKISKDGSVSGEVTVNEYAKFSEMFHFESLNKTYYIRRDKQGNLMANTEARSLQVNDSLTYNITSKVGTIDTEGALDKVQLGAKANFKELYLRYAELSNTDKFLSVCAERHDIALLEPTVKEAYDVLGCDKVKALKYRKSYVENELVKLSKLDDVSKVYKLIDTYKYRTGTFVASADVKSDMQDIFAKLGIKGKAKSTDIERYFNVESRSIYKDGKTVRGYIILDCKFKIGK